MLAYTTTTSSATLKLFKMQAKAPLYGVPYKGSAPAVTDVIGGQIEFMADTVASIRAQIASGKIKALPETRQRLLRMGADPRAMSGSELQSFLKTERGTWGNVIRAANIKIDGLFTKPSNLASIWP